jgi:uncharacterized membrane protein YfcA
MENLVPVIMFLVIGLIWISYMYFRARERQQLINNGTTAEELARAYNTKKKKSRDFLIVTGVISIFFGIGLGVGMYLDDVTGKDYWIPLPLFVATGIGFIVASKSSQVKDTNGNE